MLFWGLGFALIVLALAAYAWHRQGRSSAQNDEMKQVLDDIHTANMVRDALEHDASIAKRVRERFTR